MRQKNIIYFEKKSLFYNFRYNENDIKNENVDIFYFYIKKYL